MISVMLWPYNLIKYIEFSYSNKDNIYEIMASMFYCVSYVFHIVLLT